jgi:hypothetical protein
MVADPGIFNITSDQQAILHHVKKPTWQLRFIVDFYPVVETPLDHEHGGRLTVGSTEIPIKDWTFEEPDNEVAGSLTITLAFNNHRALLTKDANLKFESLRVLGGVEVWDTLFELGRIGSKTYTQAYEDDLPANVVQFVGNPPIKAKLDISPLNVEVYYDPNTQELDPNEFETIPDTEGNNIITNLNPMGNMKFRELLHRVMTEICGFDDVETDIPNIEINRLDIPPGQSAYEAVMSLIPMYNADPSAVGNVLWVRNGTAIYADGMPAPRQLHNTYLSNSGISTEYNRLRGIIVQYAQKGLDWDTFTITIESSGNPYGIGMFASAIEYERYIVKYYKSSRPNVVVKEVILREKRWYYNNGQRIKIITDNYAIDTWGRQVSRQSILELGYYDILGLSFDWVLTENEQYLFRSHPYKQDNYYTRAHYIYSEGMVYIDTVNTQADQPFVRSVMDTVRGGNFVPELTNEWRAIKTYRQEQIPISRDRVSIVTSETDHLSTPVYINQEIQANKVGDIGVSFYSMNPKMIFVPSKNPDPQATKVETLNVGELNVDEGINLAERLIYISNNLPNRADINWIGIDSTLTKGTPFEAFDEDGVSLGYYIVEGRFMRGSLDEGFFTRLNGRQVR